MEVNGQLHASAALPPGTENLLPTEQEIECGPRASLDVQKTDPSCPCRESNQHSTAVQPVFGHLLTCQLQVPRGLLIFCRLQSHAQNQSELLLLVLLSRPLLLLPFLIAKCSSLISVRAGCCVLTCIIGSVTTEWLLRYWTRQVSHMTLPGFDSRHREVFPHIV